MSDQVRVLSEAYDEHADTISLALIAVTVIGWTALSVFAVWSLNQIGEWQRLTAFAYTMGFVGGVASVGLSFLARRVWRWAR